jgi:hypothetical protein
MSQQINLINPALIKQKDFFTAVNIGLLYAVFVAVLGAWVWQLKQQSEPLLAVEKSATARLAEMQAQMDQMLLANQPHDEQLAVAQLKALEDKKMQQTFLIETIAKSQTNAPAGLAKYMRGLAMQKVDAVWLTGFTIDAMQHSVNLKGRSLNAEILPVYIQQLGEQPVFSGQAFGGLSITTPAPVVNPDGVSAPSVAMVGRAEHVENKVNNSSQDVLPVFVEFELQALDVKGLQTNDVISKGET